MKQTRSSIVNWCRLTLIGSTFLLCAQLLPAQGPARTQYNGIAEFRLTKSVQVTEQTIQRDRAKIILTGTLYFPDPVEGRHLGAVFVGKGKFTAAVPESPFEKEHVKRLLKTDVIDTDFTNAVFRVSDNVLDELGVSAQAGAVPAGIQKAANDHDADARKHAGVNVPARLAVALANSEKEGVFYASFSGGKMDDFSFVFDPRTTIPTAYFDVNGGEKGLLYRYNRSIYSSEILMAFYGESDYQRGRVEYSDMSDLVDILSYDIELDLSSPRSRVSLRTGIKMLAFTDAVSAIPFLLGESLGTFEDARQKKQLMVSSVRFQGKEIDFVQEEWEGGFTAFLPVTVKRGDPIELEVAMSGDFLVQPDSASGFSYPRSTTSWYPRHGYLDRAEYRFKFTHAKKLKIACVGNRLSEIESPEDKGLTITQYHMDHPISLATFALGPYQRNNEIAKWDGTEDTLPLEFNSITTMPLKESFIMAELSNSVRYFHKLFGAYPYKTYSASFHPYGFGQGFPSMLMIPGTDRANKYTYAFIAHETAHQWWGNIVAWRSYRDQWLSEGFAEYSGVLYTGLRDSPKASLNLIDEMRASLKRPPQTMTGMGKGKLNDVGPIILGHRLSSSKTFGGYQTLVYNKGALVLRMLHFLFTDPNSGSGDAFFDMMRDFVQRHRNNTASTDDFRAVANEHLVNTPAAKRYGIRNLDWFFKQWVYETHFPSYSMEYSIEAQPDGSTIVSGNVFQKNVPDDFFMPLPITMSFSGGRVANGTVAALGAQTPFKIKLPAKPDKVTLDPSKWVLSEDTSTK